MATESVGWTPYDKLAGFGALALLSGYFVDPIGAAVGTGMQAALALPVVGHVAWTATVVGPLQVWLARYVGCSLSTGIVARRIVARVA